MFVFTLAALQTILTPLRASDGGCHDGAGSAVVVKISGFKSRAGQVRVRLFGPPASTYFNKKKALVRIQTPVPKTGQVEICVEAPRPGVYAVDVRHDANGNGRTDRQDGGGASGNPQASLMDILLSRKPDPRIVQFTVGAGTTVVPVTLMYLQGGSFKPLKGAK